MFWHLFTLANALINQVKRGKLKIKTRLFIHFNTGIWIGVKTEISLLLLGPPEDKSNLPKIYGFQGVNKQQTVGTFRPYNNWVFILIYK